MYLVSRWQHSYALCFNVSRSACMSFYTIFNKHLDASYIYQVVGVFLTNIYSQYTILLYKISRHNVRTLISNTSNRKINNILSIELHATKRLPSSFNEKGVYAAFQCICKSCTRSQWLLRLETWSPSVDSLRSGIKNLKSFYFLHFKLQVIPTFLNSQTTRIVEKITKIYIIK